jgi:hypothetical protein
VAHLHLECRPRRSGHGRGGGRSDCIDADGRPRGGRLSSCPDGATTGSRALAPEGEGGRGGYDYSVRQWGEDVLEPPATLRYRTRRSSCNTIQVHISLACSLFFFFFFFSEYSLSLSSCCRVGAVLGVVGRSGEHQLN